MSSRTDILNRIRKNSPDSAPHPGLPLENITYPDREQQFLETLRFVGGQGQVVPTGGLESAVRGLGVMSSARQVVCTIPGVALGNVNLAEIAEPHHLEPVDVAILPGDFAVAENAAVWISDRQTSHRVIAFICQHLVLVVPRQQLVDTLHQAYARLEFSTAGYGVFISGPSKTADIEQSLVIVGHGPRSLNVLLLDD